ncbi:UDP-4-amino-4,6-dideoxy-N-acetyl-beta-L-altrosamine transaminase [Desulfovibrio litoralis]|uniref:Perosamine synthetase n=1 Tax=Desulfovibrio litoralis DSM 11393 TaxID=1121455 RepID=A0A1M7T674_9BACT|nr:UDP-4-amino-4,6-dideoxy-N-acetyl-beta-L-altrosamine transaminase [Desulfovibrio litoralis]SHN66244.1 perosamine synthetase [Desulfovibrio litoralis DSM 11393]
MSDSSSLPFIPYGKQWIDEDDISAVVEVLRSDWLTTGPKVTEFENAVAAFCGAKHAASYANGTAALHGALFALGIKKDDEVIVPTLTFAASSNAVLFLGAKPVFADVDPDTLLIDPKKIEALITPKTKAIIGVDYAGQPCDWVALQAIAKKHKLKLLADACHSIGGEFNSKKVGTLADITVFSFHPVKQLTTGEGGMALTDSDEYAERLRLFRGHGITSDHRQREKTGAWFYEMQELGYNYRLTDIQSALGLSQLKKLPAFLKKRRELAKYYDQAFLGSEDIKPLKTDKNALHAYHLYVVRVPERDKVFKILRERGIGCNVHYIPVHLHPYYQREQGTKIGLCPVAEEAYGKIITLPLHYSLSEKDLERVVCELKNAIKA